MSETKKAASPKAISDVAHPGKSAPSDTSKPIITHRPRMKDPMVVEGATDELEDTAKTPLSKKTGELKLLPADEPAAEGPVENETKPKEKPGTAPEKPETPETDSPDEPEPEAGAEDKPETEPDKGKKPKQPDPEAEAAAQAEQDAKLQKLIEGKKYFLPINAVEQRRSKRFVALGIFLALVLAVAWVDIALDASLIHLGNIKPVTHLFSN